MVLARFLRPLAIFLFVMAVLAAFEWIFAAAFVDWPYRLVNLDYYGGDIRVVYHPPLPHLLIYNWDDPESSGDFVLNRECLYHFRSDFVTQPGDTGKPE